MDYDVEQVELKEQPTAVVRGVVPQEGMADFLGEVYGDVLGVLGNQGLHPAGMPFGCYVRTTEGFEVEAGFPASGPVKPIGHVVASSLPAGPAIQVLHRGPYTDLGAAYSAAKAWLVANRWEATGPPWEAYLDDPEVAEPRTIVSFPCRPL